MTCESEVWKPIEGYDGMYEVSNRGRVRSYHKSTRAPEIPHVLRAGNTRGYRTVVLCSGRKHRPRLVHQLVAEAFLGLPPPMQRPTVNHKNLDKADNRIENLEWMSHADNNRHAAPHLPRNRGESNHSKLREDDVRRMRQAHRAGESCAQLGRTYGVSQVTAWKICRRQKWAHI